MMDALIQQDLQDTIDTNVPRTVFEIFNGWNGLFHASFTSFLNMVNYVITGMVSFECRKELFHTQDEYLKIYKKCAEFHFLGGEHEVHETKEEI